eukprot:462885-Karenia_brevis.AAC.1
MLGWAPPASGLMPRIKAPEQSLDEWLAGREERNQGLVKRVRSSGDFELDALALLKSYDEVGAGVLLGPFESLSELPVADPALAIRHGIWECHGESESPSVRDIDDLLAGEQNSTAGTVCAHRPTDVDGLAAQIRALCDRHPQSKFAGLA